MTRRGAAFAVLGLLAALALPAVQAAAAAASPGSPCADAAVSVAVVVDYGGSGSVSAECVPASSTDTEIHALMANHSVTFNSSGLVCSIDHVPESGCGAQNGSTFAYWSYWHGTTSGWEYADDNPNTLRVKSTRAEGWRFQPNGSASPSDPPPRGSPDPEATCPPLPPPTSPSNSPQADPAPPPPSTGTAPPGSASAPTSSTSSTAIDGPTSTTATSAASAASAPSTTGASSNTNEVADGVRIGGSSGSRASSSSSPVPVALAGGAIVGMGVGGLVIARRRGGAGP